MFAIRNAPDNGPHNCIVDLKSRGIFSKHVVKGKKGLAIEVSDARLLYGVSGTSPSSDVMGMLGMSTET